MNKADFKEKLSGNLYKRFGTDIKKATVSQLHQSICDAVTDYIDKDWKESRQKHLSNRRACYLSMEFLMGRAVYNNLLCLGLTEDVKEILSENGRSLDELEEIPDAALGNGGLGRLAACFLDSAATHNLPLDGYGIRYKYGLFRQTIENGFQHEYADDWTKSGGTWNTRKDEESITVHFADMTVMAVPYDMPIIGFGTKNIGTLRLWQAEADCNDNFDFTAFDSGDYEGAVRKKNMAENISKVLYPNDNTKEGKILRLRQEYFFSAATVADALRKHKKNFGNLDTFAEKVTMQLNDTHPVIAIPELIRQLLNEGCTFDKAFETASKVFCYTNHTVMSEALEKWDCSLVEEILPEVFGIIQRINEKFVNEMFRKGMDRKEIMSLAPISQGRINMAYMAVYVSSYVNGVAEIHTEILKNDVLKDWYKLYPKKFLNETNGITQRRWLALCNPELSALITKLLGSAEWVKNLELLKGLEKFADDENVLKEFMAVKEAKKYQLAEYIKEQEGIEIDPHSIFDVQIKRLHEYKRQLLNALSILYIYYGLKDGSIRNFTPTTFIFGAKSAPGYRRAKAIIKFINEIANLVNNDKETNKLLKVVFVHNYNVSYAEKLVCGADVSEQISTAGTEASGTGNMKLMLNGACTLGTYDGANIEIFREAGLENNYVFGAKVEQLKEIMPRYEPRKILAENEKINRVVEKLMDGTFDDGGVRSDMEGSFKELYKALTDGASWHVPDHYYVIGDLQDYIDTKLTLNKDYKNSLAYAKKCWMNIANSGKFSSDRTIKDYSKNIWHISAIADV